MRKGQFETVITQDCGCAFFETGKSHRLCPGCAHEASSFLDRHGFRRQGRAGAGSGSRRKAA